MKTNDNHGLAPGIQLSEAVLFPLAPIHGLLRRCTVRHRHVIFLQMNEGQHREVEAQTQTPSIANLCYSTLVNGERTRLAFFQTDDQILTESGFGPTLLARGKITRGLLLYLGFRPQAPNPDFIEIAAADTPFPPPEPGTSADTGGVSNITPLCKKFFCFPIHKVTGGRPVLVEVFQPQTNISLVTLLQRSSPLPKKKN